MGRRGFGPTQGVISTLLEILVHRVLQDSFCNHCAVSTLLEILQIVVPLCLADEDEIMFQPFLRFYLDVLPVAIGELAQWMFQPFLRFYVAIETTTFTLKNRIVSTLLEILHEPFSYPATPFGIYEMFQPFLRFYPHGAGPGPHQRH